MKLHRHPAFLTLLAAFSIAGCSRPAATPKPQEPQATTSPQPTSPAQPPTAAAPNEATAQPADQSPATDQSISANVGDPAKFRSVMTTLQQAAQKHDAATVAALVSYPIDINPHTKKVLHIRTPEAFIAQYDSIITAHLADVIAKQKYSDLFVNDQGAMFGSGELWVAGICRDKTCSQTDIKIRTIQNTEGANR